MTFLSEAADLIISFICIQLNFLHVYWAFSFEDNKALLLKLYSNNYIHITIFYHFFSNFCHFFLGFESIEIFFSMLNYILTNWISSGPLLKIIIWNVTVYKLDLKQGRSAYHDAHLGPFRTILSHLDQFWTIWDLSGLLGAIWGHLGQFGTSWDHLGQLVASENHLGPFETIWDYLGPFGTIWDHLWSFCTNRTIWDQLGPFGTIWDHLG